MRVSDVWRFAWTRKTSTRKNYHERWRVSFPVVRTRSRNEWAYAYDADGERMLVYNASNGSSTFRIRGLDNKPLREVRYSGGVWSWGKDWIYRDGGHPEGGDEPRLRSFPFTLWALVALAFSIAIVAFDLSYDDGGLGSVLILSQPFWGVMYWLPSELLYAVNNSHSIPGHWLLSVVMGLALSLAADLSLRSYRRRRRRGGR